MEVFANPFLEVYDEVFKACLTVTPSVFDYLDGSGKESRPSPFVFVGETMGSDDVTKTQINGSISQTVHIFAEREDREQLMKVTGRAVNVLRKMESSQHYALRVSSVRTQVLPENDDIDPLVHVILELEVRFS